MLIEKGPLDSMATKDKGKVAITAIEYFAPDRTMLFSFYNHLQPFWVWADTGPFLILESRTYTWTLDKGYKLI